MSECSSPPEIPERDLLRLLGGEQDSEIEGHLEQCAHCSARLKDLRRALNRLTRKVYRMKCPSSMELTAYALGESNAEDSRRIGDHLALCSACREELTHFHQFIEATRLETGPKTGLGERLGIWIADLVSAGRGRMTPAGIGLRGDETSARIYAAGDLQVALTILAEKGGRSRITGLLSGAEPEGWTADLWREDERLSSAQVDGGGEFSFEAVAPGMYTLILDGPQDEIHIQDLQV